MTNNKKGNNNNNGKWAQTNSASNNGWWKDKNDEWHSTSEKTNATTASAANSSATTGSKYNYNYGSASAWGDDYGRYAGEGWYDLYKNCHTGNNAIFTIGEGTLYAGGWMRGVKPEAGWIVIDLASHYDIVGASCRGFERATEVANKRYANQVFSFYIKDFGTPDQKQEFWVALAEDVKDLLMQGKNILVACEGGHGRTGMVLAILSHLLGMTDGGDPIEYIRKIHCQNAVETLGQEKYVYEMCGLTMPVHTKGAENQKHCCYCGATLITGIGDDLEAEVCVDCIKEFKMTKGDLEMLANGGAAKVKAELAAVTAEVADEVEPKVVGLCVYCGQNLYDDGKDDLEEGVCMACIQWMHKQGIPYK